MKDLEPWSVYLRVPAEYGSLPELRETESGQPQTPPHPRKRTTADAGAAAAAACYQKNNDHRTLMINQKDSPVVIVTMFCRGV